MLLSKSKYPAEDLHLDVIVWLQSGDEGPVEGELQASLHEATGAALSTDTLRQVPGDCIFFSVPFPSEMAGHDGLLRVTWSRDEQEMGRAEATFAVLPHTDVETSGRIRLTVPNDHGATLDGVPMTVGIPFPRGALHEADRVRLVDADDREIPLQATVTSRWSRFWSIRWLLCDFVADVAGSGTELFLEYGPDVRREQAEELVVAERDGAPPRIDAGAIRVDDGIEFDAGDGAGYRRVLGPESLSGAFVEHENGKRFVMP
ncbi:MAG: hypothetical protein ACOC7J_05175, partial [Armatimonadota bacterium]